MGVFGKRWSKSLAPYMNVRLTSVVGMGISTLIVAFVVQLFVEMGDLKYLAGLNSHKSCELVLHDHQGFEDFGQFEGGGFISFSSDRSYSNFVFGTSMRDTLKEKMLASSPAPIYPVIIETDGTIAKHAVRVENIPGDFEFNPHGIAVIGRPSDANGAAVIVVNHRSTTDSLEMFQIVQHSDHMYGLKYKSTFAHPLLYNMNDCISVDENNIYCTNYRSSPTGSILDMIEIYGRMPWSNVVHCDLSENRCKIVAEGLRMANGIEITNDRSYVIVVASMDKSILVYKRNAKDNSLEKLARIPTPSICDNLVWDRSGNDHVVLAGCHPKGLSFVAHSMSPTTKNAPCEVLRIGLDDIFNGITAAKPKIKTLYMDPKGGEMSACSVAAFTGRSDSDGERHLWIGAVHDHGILRCPVSKMKPPTESEALRSRQDQ